MNKSTSRWPAAATSEPIETLLEDRYGQLQMWGRVLARGDEVLAEEIVHDLCLQLTLSPPDCSRIANLEGYLYTCLRHLYVSKLARASREAVRFVSVADCDSLRFAQDAGQRLDSLEIQNVLRRICSYSIWRREQAKGFSYFILHFFHGYFHGEIAELACLPLAAIYNKLKAARSELRIHLEAPEKLRIGHRREAPRPAWMQTAIPSEELFRELRCAILASRRGECLAEEELLGHYGAANPAPLPCSLLAHIVSCERCLELVDRHLRRPTLHQRDALDGIDPSPTLVVKRGSGAGRGRIGALQGRLRRLSEHRPGTLSIAVNGRIVGSHDVRGESGLLEVRAGSQDSVEFVEVFSEQNVRLAMLSIRDRPPAGPHTLQQRVELSDDRRLELRLVFDGLGLNCELSYFDRAFAPNAAGDEVEELEATANGARQETLPAGDSLASEVRRGREVLEGSRRRRLHLWPAFGWGLALPALCCVGYLLWRSTHRPPDAQTILERSMRAEAGMLAGHAEHQEISLEEVGAGGQPVAEGSVDLWRDGVTGRSMRRLYDSHHRLVAAEWKGKGNVAGSYAATIRPGAPSEDRLLASDPGWKQGLSPSAFREIVNQRIRVTADREGYRLVGGVEEGREQPLVYVTLILNRSWMPVGELLRMRTGSTVREVRLMQTQLEEEPASSVPEEVFDPGVLRSEEEPIARSSIAPAGGGFSTAEDVRLAALDIGVLYELHELAMDTGEPIQVERVPGGRIRVTGSLSGGERKDDLLASLRSLPDQRALEVHLDSPAEVGALTQKDVEKDARSATVYELVARPPLAEPVLRAYFEEHPRPDLAVDAAVAKFEGEGLTHAQAALQHAYALDRLGNEFTAAELYRVDGASRREWAEMVEGHATALEGELRALAGEMNLIGIRCAPGTSAAPDGISSPAEFAQASQALLNKTQRLNRRIDAAFASDMNAVPEEGARAVLESSADSIPLTEAASMERFAEHLKDGGEGASGGRIRAEDRSSPAPIH